MNLADLISFNGVAPDGLDPKVKSAIEDLVKRLEDFRVQIFDQLRAQPDVYFADPGTADGQKIIQGAKQGDIAVWRGTDGMDHWMILGMPVPQAAAVPPVGANLTTDKVSLLYETAGTAQGYYIRDGKLTTT